VFGPTPYSSAYAEVKKGMETFLVKKNVGRRGAARSWQMMVGVRLFFYFLDPCIFWILIDQHVPLATGLRYFNIRWHDYQSGGLFRCWALGDFQK